MRLTSDLRDQLLQAQQNARNAFAQAQPGAGGPVGEAFFTTPGSTIAGGASLSCTIFRQTGATTTNLGSATVYNRYASTVVASKICTLNPDGTGAYIVLGQSCT